MLRMARKMFRSRPLRELISASILMAAYVLPVANADNAIPMYAPDKDEQIGTYDIPEGALKRLTENGYLPMRSTFMTDVEIAQKLDLSLPQLAKVKSALDKEDKPALQKALGDYLTQKLPPFKPASPPKPLPFAGQWNHPDAWFGSEITYNFNGEDVKYPIGERLNWYHEHTLTDGGPAFVLWGVWSNPLGSAYLATGDEKYARMLLKYAHSFYKNARPPAQMPSKVWSGAMGPWSIGCPWRVWRIDGSVPWSYQAIGGSSVMTDADRVMFLKIIYENAEQLYIRSEDRNPHNFEVSVVTALMYAALICPEFIESKLWLERTAQRYNENIHDTMMDDGVSYERTGYHMGYVRGFLQGYRTLRDAGVLLPGPYKKVMEKICEATMYLLSPTLEFPLFGFSSLGDYNFDIVSASNLFPERDDFAYAATFGKNGNLPVRLTRVFPNAGWLTMRSSWSRESLYMALNYNGCLSTVGTHDDLFSFGLWANGYPLMTNPGTPVSYADGRYKTWVGLTLGANTVMVDDQSHGGRDNGGRLESCASLSENGMGFTFLSAVHDAYRRLGVTHRRAVLFIRQGYWLMYDTLTGDGKPHTYSWLGHFQPTELTLDPVTKTVSTAPQDGNLLWLVPARPDTFILEQKIGGPIVTRQGPKMESKYISLTKSGVTNPASFTMLLYPSKSDAKPPVIESLNVYKMDKILSPVLDSEAIGVRVIHGENDDLLIMAVSPVLRRYRSKPDSIVTDGESAYVRRSEGKVTEAGLVRGKILEYNGKRLIEAGEDITGVYIQYAKDKLKICAKGSGDVSVSAGKVTGVTLNDKIVPAKLIKGSVRLRVGGMEKLTLSKPVFSTKPADLGKAMGIPTRLAEYHGYRDMAGMTWQTSLPSEAVIEYRMEGEENWLRMVNPEPATDHSFLLGKDLKDGKTYQVKIVCCSEDGRLGKTEVSYIHHDPKVIVEGK